MTSRAGSEAAKVRFRVNATDVLDALVNRGVAHRIQVRLDGFDQAVAVGDIEVATTTRTSEKALGALWKRRVGTSALHLLLVADAPDQPDSVLVFGPGRETPLRALSGEALLDALEESAAEKSWIGAVRRLAAALARLDLGTIPGVVVRGLLTTHTLERRFRGRPARWETAAETADRLPYGGSWRHLFPALGYQSRQLQFGHLLCVGEKPVAVIHPSAEATEFGRADPEGRLPEGRLVEACRRKGVRYGILAARPHEHWRYRLFDAESPAAASEWLELDEKTLTPESRPFLSLLSPGSLAEGGLAALQQEARDYGVRLWKRLDERVRQRALPALAEGFDRWAARAGFDTADEERRRELEGASLTLLFRLMFVLYAEGSHFLPVSNPLYRRKSLTALAQEAGETRDSLGAASTALWSSFSTLVGAMRSGNPAWGVPAYNGALFHPAKLAGAAVLERMALPDPQFAEVLIALGLDDEEKRGVDYSSLEIGHLGHLYESLLSLKLALADRPVRYDPKTDRYLHAEGPAGDHGANRSGALLWQTHEGGRKAGGVYYTPTALVRHLVDRAVRPAFRAHLARVEKIAEADRAEAAAELLRFRVVDPACGSGHFLVQVVDALADETARFLDRVPLPALRERLDRLHPAGAARPVEDMALLRRLLVKHCVFGVDLSPMGAEIATLSLWLAAFVPGLALSFLGRNVVVGNSLLGVADRNEVIAPGTFEAAGLDRWLRLAAEAVAQVAESEDRTPEEYEESQAADLAASEAAAGLRRVFDLWSAEPFGQPGNQDQVRAHGARIADETLDDETEARIEAAAGAAKRHSFLHWPLVFPEVFRRERPGFDAVVGNPPWKEVTVEELSFYALYRPGLHGAAGPDRELAVAELSAARPELVERLAAEQRRAAEQREALRAGGFASTAGNPDLYKFFCHRYRALAREGGFLGVVLPRSAFNTKGSAGFRKWLHRETTVRRVDFLLNNRSWMFDTHAQYSVSLLAAERVAPPADHRVAVAGTATSEREWRRQAADHGVELGASGFGPGLQIPPLRSGREAALLEKVRVGSPFPLGPGGRWRCFAVRELDETDDRSLWKSGSGERKLWKGASFDQYDPGGAGARRLPASSALWKKIRKPRPGSGQRLGSLPLAERQRAVGRELERARVAFRDVTNRTNSRTVLACLVPPGVFLTNKAPYLAFIVGDQRTQAAALGVLNSLPFDWQARRFVEINLNFHLLEGLVVPDLDAANFDAVAAAAARLSAVDERFAAFAEAAGVACGPLEDGERTRLRVEIDARVARAWNLGQDDLKVLFDDFTTGAVPPAYRSALAARLKELD